MERIKELLGKPVPVLWLRRVIVIQWSGMFFIVAAMIAEIAGFSPPGTLFFILGMVFILTLTLLLTALAVINTLLLERKRLKPPDEQRS